MILQGHPRSLIVAPIESEHVTSYWSSIITLVLSCRVSDTLLLGFVRRKPLFHIHPRILAKSSGW